MKTRNILLIVEGEVAEVEFLKRFGELFFDDKTQIIFYPYRSNIYSLYHKIKKYDNMTDTIAVLKEMAITDVQKNLLKRKFSEIYLIFDYDPQDPAYTDEKIIEMIDLFNDETDLGKLYINYPMIESFRDHDNFNVQDYLTRNITIGDISSKKYKQYIHDNGWNKSVSQITQRHFKLLCKINIIKSNQMLFAQNKMPTQNNYKNCTSQNSILYKEIELKNTKNEIAVLNTCMFFILDYFGDKYYKEIVKTKN